ncbi:hypothetical protein BH23ACT5_BH23ACT5_13190 [soil metagenome]
MTVSVTTVASASTLLVVCDFDGVLAPLVAHPDDAAATGASMTALRRLAALPNTIVAIVSGRRRSDLIDRFADDDFILIGEHGSDLGAEAPVDRPSMILARELVDSVVARTPGARAEHKARSVAFHYRQAESPQEALATLRGAGDHLDGVTMMEGKKVLELTTSSETKGRAVARLRSELGASAVLFIGDDVTDETVFESLGAGDLGVKVGEGPTAAVARVDDPGDVAEFLESLASARGTN